ncbi:WxL protein peptidoglycan domain-containing protein [Lacticaseibacillus suihuaensis]
MKHLLMIAAVLLGTALLAPVQPTHALVNDFSAKAVLPADNAAGKSYLALTLTPSRTRTLTVAVTNTATTAQRLQVAAANAVTNPTGMITYDQGTAQTAPSHLSFTQMLGPDRTQTVRVGPGATRRVSFTLTVPRRRFAGLVLGAFNVTSRTAAAKAKHQAGFANLANYVIGVSLQEVAKMPVPRLSLNRVRYHYSGSPALALTFTNAAPVIIGNATMRLRLTSVGKRPTTVRRRQLAFAPSNRFTLKQPLATAGLAAGRYRLVATVVGDNGRWRFTRGFTVSAKAGRQATVKRVRAAWRSHWSTYLMRLIDLLAVLIVAGYLLRKLLKWRRKR